MLLKQRPQKYNDQRKTKEERKKEKARREGRKEGRKGSVFLLNVLTQR